MDDYQITLLCAVCRKLMNGKKPLLVEYTVKRKTRSIGRLINTRKQKRVCSDSCADELLVVASLDALGE